MSRVTFVIALCAALVGSMLWVGAGQPAAALVMASDTPTQGWRVNGRVEATVVVGDAVIVGGTFTTATSPSGVTAARRNLAAFSMATGELLSGWRADAGAPVRALVTDGTSVWVGGAFGRIGTVTRTRLAKIDAATGTVDPAFVATADNTVRALALHGSSLYAGGAFLSANGQSRTRLAKFDASSGALDPLFRNTANNVVMGLAKNPRTDALYVSGSFTALNTVPRNGVGVVSGTSTATTSVVFASAARPTLGLATNEDGSRLFGAGGSGSNAAAAWDTATGVRTWRQVADGDIQAVAYYSNTVYFGFHDGLQGDPTVKMLAANAATGQLQSFYPRFDGFWGVFAISAGPRGVVAGGEFTNVSGVPAEGFARFQPLDSPAPEPVERSYLDSTTAWSYWDANSRPAGWHTLDFDDSGWRRGLTQLGYGDGDEQTTIDFGGTPSSRNLTAYFRAEFTPAEVPRLLTLQLLADDGAVVYLNGIQQVRDNMPDGTIGHTTLASTVRSGGPENALRPFSINPAQLRVGQRNVLAVEVHQANATSDDLGFDADLVARISASSANQLPVPSFTSSVNLQDVAFDARASSDPDGSIASYAWDFGDGSEQVTTLTPTTSHRFPAAGSYTVTLRVTDGEGASRAVAQTVTTQSATVTQDVVADGSTWRWRWLPTTPAAGWNDVGFDTSTWHENPAVLGWGAGSSTDITTLEPFEPAARPRAVYFARAFSVADASKARAFTVRTVANDGVVVYVNGIEVARKNMPTGTPTVNTLASAAPRTAVASSTANLMVIDVPVGLLRTGPNVVAAETHLRSRTTTDVSFDLRATLESTR
jgi:PKD repeat protein